MVPRRYAGPAAWGTFFMLFLGYWGQVPSQSPILKPFAVVSYFRMRSAPLVHHVDRALRRMAQSNAHAALSSSSPSGTLHLCSDSSASRSMAWRLPSMYSYVAQTSTCSGNCPSVIVVGACSRFGACAIRLVCFHRFECVVIITLACDLQSSWDRRAILLLAASAPIDCLSQDHPSPAW
jgi:hypothetical protein